MIDLTKEQLADLLRDAYKMGAVAAVKSPRPWSCTQTFDEVRERAIQRLIHRSSGGHDDHGREVE